MAISITDVVMEHWDADDALLDGWCVVGCARIEPLGCRGLILEKKNETTRVVFLDPKTNRYKSVALGKHG